MGGCGIRLAHRVTAAPVGFIRRCGLQVCGIMHGFETDRLLAEAASRGTPYVEFLRVPSMSLGVYRLPRESVDTQAPHREDEVYIVLRGRGSFRAGTEDRRVGPGTILFVEAGSDHRFHDIEEDLALLVFFAPAES